MTTQSKLNRSIRLILGAAALLGSISAAGAATQIRVQFTGTGPVGFAPLFSAFHDGSYDIFDPGVAASPELETLAEVGDPGGLIGNAPASANAGPVFGNNPSPPVFTVGGSNSAVFTVDDSNTRFSYASMLLASNDWFVGNGDPNAYDVSSLIGAIAGTSVTIDVTTVWDAGTELEDFAFSAGNPIIGVSTAGDAPNGTDQGGVVTMVTGPDPFAAFANIPNGYDTTAVDFTGASVASITLTVVPEPSTALLGGLAGSFLLLRRRR